MRIHHIAIQVSDLKAAEVFYSQILQLPVIRRQEHSIWCSLETVVLMLEKCSRREIKPSFYMDEPQIHILSFEIDLEAKEVWKKRLQLNQVIITKESTYTIYFQDYDGNRLALSHYPRNPVEGEKNGQIS